MSKERINDWYEKFFNRWWLPEEPKVRDSLEIVVQYFCNKPMLGMWLQTHRKMTNKPIDHLEIEHKFELPVYTRNNIS